MGVNTVQYGIIQSYSVIIQRYAYMNKMFSIERQSEILKLLEQNGRAEVNELAKLFGSSCETIRRDLNEMEINGLLKRTHGGAVLEKALSSQTREFPVNIREIQRFKEKNAICKLAATYIRNGDSIFIDNSSTCLYLVQHIPTDYQVTIITNSIKLLMGTTEVGNPNHTFVCLGGFYHKENSSTYGSLSLRDAGDFFPNKSFMSCAGILPPNLFTDSSLLEVDTKRLMIERSKEVFILADRTKFGRSSPVFLCDSDAVDTVITDDNADPDLCAAIQKSGVDVLQAQVDRTREI